MTSVTRNQNRGFGEHKRILGIETKFLLCNCVQLRNELGAEQFLFRR